MKNHQQQIERASKYSAVILGFSIPISTTLTSIFFVLTLLLVIVSGHWREKWFLAKSNPLILAALALFLFFLIGCFYSIASLHSRLSELRQFHGLLFLPIILSIFTEEKWRRWGLSAFMFAMLIQLIGGTYLNVFISPEISTVSRDHISVGVMMVFACFVYFHLIFEKQGKKRYLFMALFVTTALYLLFINTGRTAYVLFFVLMIFSLFQIWQWHGLLMGLLLSVLLVLGAFYFSPIFHKKIMAAADNALHYQELSSSEKTEITSIAKPTSGGLRLQWMHDSVQIFKAYPIAGAGTGSYLTATRLLFPNYDAGYFTDKPHNDVFTIATQLGVLGLLGLLALYVCHGYISLFLPQPYNRFSQLLLVIFLVGGIFNSLLRDGATSNFYVYMAALCMAQYKSPRKDERN